jgi:hypothetical protein
MSLFQFSPDIDVISPNDFILVRKVFPDKALVTYRLVGVLLDSIEIGFLCCLRIHVQHGI